MYGRSRLVRGACAALLLVGLSVSTAQGGVLRSAPTDAQSMGAPDPVVVAEVRRGVVRIEAATYGVQPDGTVGEGASSGSGFVISTDGLVVTNFHVIAGGGDAFLVYLDGVGEPVLGSLVGYDECADIAVLRIEATDLAPLTWATASPEVGRGVLAAGYPDGDPRFALMDGFVARESGPWPNAWSSVDQAIEHTAAIRPGDSGGPLVDAMTGEVLGVDYGTQEPGARSFAIDASEASAVASRLGLGGSPGSIGVEGRAVPPTGETPGFIVVESVAQGSRAAAAGLMAGDFITSIAGQPATADGTMSRYCDVAEVHAVGPIDLAVVRGSRTLEGQIDGTPLRAVVQAPTAPTRSASGWQDFSLVTDVPTAEAPRITRDKDGGIVVVWSAGRRADGPGIYLSRRRGATWETERITTRTDLDPWVTTDASGDFHIVFERAKDRAGKHSDGIFYAKGHAGSWSVERLSRGDDGSPVVRVSRRTVHVAYRRMDRSVTYMKRTGGGKWARKTFPARNGCCGVVLRVDDAGKAHLAWNGTGSVLYATNKSGRWFTTYWASPAHSVGDVTMTIGKDQIPRLVFRDGANLVYAVLRNPKVTKLKTEGITSGDSPFGVFREPRLILDGSRPVVTWAGDIDVNGVFLARRTSKGWQLGRLTDGRLDASPSILAANGTLHLAFAEAFQGIWYTHN